LLARLVFGLGGVNVGATVLEVLGILGAGAAGALSVCGFPDFAVDCVTCCFPRFEIASRVSLGGFGS